MYIKEVYERLTGFVDGISWMLTEKELSEIGEIEAAIGEYIDNHEEEDIKYFNCPHCDMMLENQRNYDPDIENQNEFWCHECGITYIIEGDEIIEEEDSIDEKEENNSAETERPSLADALNKVFDTFTDYEGNLRPWFDDDGNEVALEEAINNVFVEYPDEAAQYNVEVETLFENPSYIVGYISIAWTNEDGELWHETHQWEVV